MNTLLDSGMDLQSVQLVFFGNDLEKDKIWMGSNLNDRVHTNVRKMLQQDNIIIKRQYDTEFELNAEELEYLKARTISIKVNNISYEELVGMQSSLKARGINAILYNCATNSRTTKCCHIWDASLSLRQNDIL